MKTLALVLALACCVACSRYDEDETVTIPVPPLEDFGPLGSLLEAHCGTLDCHGSPARNLRVYGVHGLRADGSSVTGSPDTTEEEVRATYQSLVAVDPEALGAVFAEQGRAPDRWLVTRKALGTEEHTGGAPLPPESAGDRCLLAWLSGDHDDSACNDDSYAPTPRPGEEW